MTKSDYIQTESLFPVASWLGESADSYGSKELSLTE